jgi:uncharacterized damage-inducible protein DinB
MNQNDVVFLAKRLLAFALVISLPERCFGEPSNADRLVEPELAQAFSAVAADIAAAAELMPADKYSYRPTPEVRSFGQIIAHIVGGQFLYAAQVSGTYFPSDIGPQMGELRAFSEAATVNQGRAFTKVELIQLLKRSSEFCATAYEMGKRSPLPDSTAADDSRRFRALIKNIAHDNEHYGNLVTYMRLNGLVPPSTQAKAGSK